MALQEQKWEIDQAHSSISFNISHLQLNKVNGALLGFNGHIIQPVLKTFVGSRFYFEGNADSIFTGHSERDTHLKSADFFDTLMHPNIHFKSSEVNRIDDTHYFIAGMLGLKGLKRKINLTAHFKGMAKGIDGVNRMGLEMTCQLEPKTFEMVWNGINEDGIPLIGDHVWVHICLQFKDSEVAAA